VAAKLVVTNTRGGSRITLVGTSGTELLTSKVFTEPRAKGATLRSLRGLLGDGIVVEDNTANVTDKVPAATKAAPGVTTGPVAKPSPVAKTGPIAKTNGKPTARRRKTAVSK
jgi:hypothetical protein